MGSTQPFVIALVALGLLGVARRASADEPKPATQKPATEAPAAPPVSAPELPDAAPQAAPAPKPVARLKPAKPELPVEVSIEATSPDPPWKFQIKNTGERPIRVPADIRLLSLELTHKTTKGHKRRFKCSAPAAMRSRSFPQKRELYLDPGQVYEEVFDPRLLCFGAAADALAGGTKVEPVFGWAGTAWSKGPYAAQGVDRPEEHQARRNVKAASFELSGTDPAIVKPSTHFAMPSMEREGAEGGPDKPGGFAAEDRNAPQLEIFVQRFEEASSPRDVVLNIRASNEGRRQLQTLVRGRMLSFVVEELGPDNRARRTFECSGQHAPHAIPIEMMRDLRPGQQIHVPILLAEVCPRNAVFLRAGLHRITPKLDPSIDGEGIKVDPWVASALARQSALVRLATARDGFYLEPPKAGGVSATAGPILERDATPAEKQPPSDKPVAP